MTRIADFAQHERNLAHILNAQQRLNEGQLKIASGKKSENYSGVARDARRIVNLEATHIRSTQFMENNKLIDRRLQTMETSVSQIFESITEYKTLLINALNADNDADLAMPTQAQSMLDQVSSLLNVEEDGRFLFAGTRTDTRPVDQTGLPGSYTIPTSTGAATGYYDGDSVQFSVQADENFSVTYGVNAGEAAFEQTIRAMHMVVIGTPGDNATLSDALAVINQAIDGVSDIRTRIGAARASLENVNARHDEFMLFAEKTISELENTDITRTITEMNADQVAVEASYAVLARLSNLNLAQFLR